MSTNQKLKYLSLAYCAYFALAIYWEWHYIGPAKFVGEIQISLFNKQWSLVNLVFLHLPVIVFLSYLGNRLQSQNPDRYSDKWNLMSGFANNLFIQNALKPIIVLIIGSIILSITLEQSLGKDIGTISIAQLTSGKIAEHSFYATISGYPDSNILVTQKGTSMPRVYVALRENSQSYTPVPLIISLDKGDIEQYIQKEPNSKTVTVSGFVTEGGEGKVKTWLEKQGVVIADNYRTITPKVNLSNRSSATYTSIFVAIASISLAAFIFYRDRKGQIA